MFSLRNTKNYPCHPTYLEPWLIPLFSLPLSLPDLERIYPVTAGLNENERGFPTLVSPKGVQIRILLFHSRRPQTTRRRACLLTERSQIKHTVELQWLEH